MACVMPRTPSLRAAVLRGLVGGTRERHFDEINLKPRKLCLKTRTPQSGSPTTTPALACGASVAPTYVVGVRVHLGRMEPSYFTKGTEKLFLRTFPDAYVIPPKRNRR